MIDYRLSPENTFPAALHDAIYAYLWLIRQAGYAPRNIVIMGDSAGGGLSLALTLWVRDRVRQLDAESGLGLPALVAVMSPWVTASVSTLSHGRAQVDLTCSSQSWEDNLLYDILPRPVGTMNCHLFYAGTEAMLRHPLVSPLYADLRGLPPLYMVRRAPERARALRDAPQQIGSAENLRDEGVLFGERARASGVDVKVEVYTDMVHVFQNFFQWVPAALQAVMDLGAYVRAKSWDDNALKAKL